MDGTAPVRDPFVRPRYFHGQLLGVDEFSAEQEYHLGTRRLHHRALHGFGVIDGLEVEVGAGAQVRVQPGLAIDPSGREIVVPESQTVDLGAWLESRQDDSPSSLALCLGYREEAVEPSATETEEPIRISETFSLTVEEAEPADDCVVVATVTVDEGVVAVERAVGPPRLPSVAGLAGMVEALALRVNELERAARAG